MVVVPELLAAKVTVPELCVNVPPVRLKAPAFIVIVPLVEVKAPLDSVKEVLVIDWEPPVKVPPLMVIAPNETA